MPKKARSPQTADRHLERRTIALTPAHYAQLTKLAERNRRPVRWEGFIAIEEHLKKEGLWPPPADEETEADGGE
jgi:hypothetical protein